MFTTAFPHFVATDLLYLHLVFPQLHCQLYISPFLLRLQHQFCCYGINNGLQAPDCEEKTLGQKVSRMSTSTRTKRNVTATQKIHLGRFRRSNCTPRAMFTPVEKNDLSKLCSV